MYSYKYSVHVSTILRQKYNKSTTLLEFPFYLDKVTRNLN